MHLHHASEPASHYVTCIAGGFFSTSATWEAQHTYNWYKKHTFIDWKGGWVALCIYLLFPLYLDTFAPCTLGSGELSLTPTVSIHSFLCLLTSVGIGQWGNALTYFLYTVSTFVSSPFGKFLSNSFEYIICFWEEVAIEVFTSLNFVFLILLLFKKCNFTIHGF